MSEPTPELIDELYREDVAAARKMSVEQRLAAGPELFDFACEITRGGIRHQNPDATDEEVEAILRQRLALAERLEASD
jgi:hypothetical protein